MRYSSLDVEGQLIERQRRHPVTVVSGRRHMNAHFRSACCRQIARDRKIPLRHFIDQSDLLIPDRLGVLMDNPSGDRVDDCGDLPVAHQPGESS